MTESNDFFIMDNTLHVSETGQLGFHFSSSLTEDEDFPDQQAMGQWAKALVLGKSGKEVSAFVLIDLVGGIKDLLATGYGHANTLGGFTVDPKEKDALEDVKRQLTEALGLMNRITYSAAEVG